MTEQIDRAVVEQALEELKFFCSQRMAPEAWLNSEPLFDNLYAALQSQAAATPKVKYVPVDSKLRDTNWNHPNDDEPRTDACQKALEERGDSEGQGLDGFWKWGFRAGFNAALQSQAAADYTTGHCKNHAQPGGCQLHNLQCGYPECDRVPK